MGGKHFMNGYQLLLLLAGGTGTHSVTHTHMLIHSLIGVWMDGWLVGTAHTVDFSSPPARVSQLVVGRLFLDW